MLNLETLRQLVSDYPDGMLTLYLHTDAGDPANQAQQPAWRIWFKNALRDLEEKIDESEQERWQQIRENALTFVSQYSPSGKTLVIFMSDEYRAVYELPFALQNAADYGQPLVTPALWALDEYERYLVARVDQEQAIISSVFLGHQTENEELTIDLDYDWGEKTLMPAASYGKNLTEGSQRDAFEDMIDDHVRRFYADVAETIREYYESTQARYILLGGNEKSATAVRDQLHPSIKDRVVNILKLPLNTGKNEMMEKIIQAASDHERDREYELVQSIIDAARAGGRGAVGINDVASAMEMGQIETLVLPWQMHDEALSNFIQRAFERNASIELVHGKAARLLTQEGGIAARLYFAIQEPSQ